MNKPGFPCGGRAFTFTLQTLFLLVLCIMSKRLFPLAFLLVLASARPTVAQSSRIGQVGVKLGGSLAQYRGEDTGGGFGNLGGFCGGGVLHLPVNSVFSIQPELLYSQKGSRSQSITLPVGYYTVSVVGDQRLNYLEMPVLAKLRSHAGPFLEAGPTFSYLLSAHIVYGQDKFDNRGDFKAFEVGYAAGVGFQSGQGFMLGVRYTHGLTSLYKAGAYWNIKGEAEVYNQVFQLYAGFVLLRRTPADFPN